MEFAAFLEASRQAGPVEQAAAALLGLSGLRVAEMCSLRVESPSQDGGDDSLTFIGKGGKPADRPLPLPVMRAVRVVVDGRTTGPLLPNRAGNALTTLDARRMVHRIARTAGCRLQAHHAARTAPHSLPRRTCQRVPMRDMQIAMRHADPRTTGLYDMAKSNKDRHASHRVAWLEAESEREVAEAAEVGLRLDPDCEMVPRALQLRRDGLWHGSPTTDRFVEIVRAIESVQLMLF